MEGIPDGMLVGKSKLVDGPYFITVKDSQGNRMVFQTTHTLILAIDDTDDATSIEAHPLLAGASGECLRSVVNTVGLIVGSLLADNDLNESEAFQDLIGAFISGIVNGSETMRRVKSERRES